MQRTRLNRILSIALSLLIVIGITGISRETVLAATDPTSGLTYTITNGAATITDFAAPTGFDGVFIIPDTLGGVSVTSIRDYAFANSITMTNITIPGCVTSIGVGVFANCSILTSINVDAANTLYKSIDGNLYSKDGKKLICCVGGKSGNFTIPSGVTNIGESAFDLCERLTGITIPDSVTNIGDKAFLSCSNLTSITIPSSVTNIGIEAFNSCTKLTSITIPKSVTSIGDHAFLHCPGMTSITVDAANTTYKSIEGILYTKDGSNLIRCPGGKSGSIMIPSGVTSIGIGAFNSCKKLTSITIPSSVTSIEEHALIYCNSLTSITVDAANTAYKSFEGILYTKDGKDLLTCPKAISGSITIPNGVINIGEEVFANCNGMTSITFPSSVTSIGKRSLVYCQNLTSITVDAANTAYKSIEGILYTKNGKDLLVCPKAKSGSFTILNGVINIGDNAFAECGGLTSIIIPSSVTSIGDCAFWLTKLTFVTIEGTLASIGNSAFYEGSGKKITFIVPTDKIAYYQNLLKSVVMGDTTAVVTDKYIVTFDVNGGVAGQGSDYTQQIAIGGLASAPGNPPARTGYVFLGWYEDASCSNKWDSGADAVTTDMTLYAKWAAIPAVPANLTAVSAGYNSNKLSWTAVSGATGYALYRSTLPTSGFTYIKTTTSASYTNTGLTTGTTYYYQIRAYTLVGTTKIYSAFASAVSAAPVQAVPTNLKAVSAGYESAKLTWTAAAGATGYALYRSTSPTGDFAYIKTVTAASYTNSGLTTGTTYYYQIRAYTLAGTTKIYSAFTSVVSAAPIPATPTGLTAASPSSSSIITSWNAVAGVTGYVVYRSTSPDSGYTYLKTVTSGSYTNTGLTAGTTYYYQIKAYTLMGTTKIYSIPTEAIGATA